MIIGVPTEIKESERRVGLTPGSAHDLISRGHSVIVQSGAGDGSGFTDHEYEAVGAKLVPDATDVFASAEMIVKVKEPQAVERAMLQPHHTLFTFLHLAADRPQTEELMASGCTAIAYETITDDEGRLPLLAPMSQVAGRLSIQAGAHYLEAPAGGAGLLLGGVPGVAPAKVTVIGGGQVGRNAIMMAVGLGADVTVLDRNPAVLDDLNNHFGPSLRTVYSTAATLDQYVVDADLVIGAVLVPGAAAPKLVSADMISRMRPGSVVVDVAIDQGGSIETAHPTTHTNPVYIVDGVVHYCVANMPGAVPRTSTLALNNATLPRIAQLAGGPLDALRSDPHLRRGLNVHAGQLTEDAVADSLDLPYVAADIAIG
ncbi:MAG: alanine dehydrogenase [Acidimicrobiales bacterium]|nr:alanine dehydrogenase [Acidimicrobiales bacterium]